MEIVSRLPLENAECPVWNPLDGALYWADIPNGKMYRRGFGEPELVFEGSEQIGALAVAEDGGIVMGLQEGRILHWKDGQVRTLCAGIPEERGRRFNDAIVDPAGRLIIGTMPGGRDAALYVFQEREARSLLALGQANGNDFSPDRKTLYVTDTRARTITAWRYDVERAAISEPVTIVALAEGEGVPDGLEVDASGNIWSARWGGGCAVCYSPDGGELRRIEIPVRNVSSVAFGGEGLSVLFVTTAKGDEEEPLAGSVFAVDAGVCGLPASLVRV